MKAISITTRFSGNGYIARACGKTCSSTNAERYAVAGLVKKLGAGDAIPTRQSKCRITSEGWQPGKWTLEVES